MSLMPFGADTLVIPLVFESEGGGVVRPQGGPRPETDERAADEAVAG